MQESTPPRSHSSKSIHYKLILKNQREKEKVKFSYHKISIKGVKT
jgi:hypothetical protein